MYNLIFYTAERGDSPLDDFLDGLDKKSRAKVAAYLSLLKEQDIGLAEKRMEDWMRRFPTGGEI